MRFEGEVLTSSCGNRYFISSYMRFEVSRIAWCEALVLPLEPVRYSMLVGRSCLFVFATQRPGARAEVITVEPLGLRYMLCERHLWRVKVCEANYTGPRNLQTA
jgi:hypothetical protein